METKKKKKQVPIAWTYLVKTSILYVHANNCKVTIIRFPENCKKVTEKNNAVTS